MGKKQIKSRVSTTRKSIRIKIQSMVSIIEYRRRNALKNTLLSSRHHCSIFRSALWNQVRLQSTAQNKICAKLRKRSCVAIEGVVTHLENNWTVSHISNKMSQQNAEKFKALKRRPSHTAEHMLALFGRQHVFHSFRTEIGTS